MDDPIGCSVRGDSPNEKRRRRPRRSVVPCDMRPSNARPLPMRTGRTSSCEGVGLIRPRPSIMVRSVVVVDDDDDDDDHDTLESGGSDPEGWPSLARRKRGGIPSRSAAARQAGALLPPPIEATPIPPHERQMNMCVGRNFRGRITQDPPALRRSETPYPIVEIPVGPLERSRQERPPRTIAEPSDRAGPRPVWRRLGRQREDDGRRRARPEENGVEVDADTKLM
jgi:hypothetical protein